MAHIEKRGRSRYRARYRDPSGLERSRTFARRTDAERFLTGIEHSMLVGGYVDPRSGRVTFRVYAEEWRLRQVHALGTVKSVEQQLRLHVYPAIGDRPIAAIRRSEIQSLVQHLVPVLGPGTVGVVYGRVVSVFRDAVRDRMIPTSPCIDVQLPMKKPSSILDVLSTEEVMALAGAISPRYKALIIAAAGTGLRPGEVFGLCVNRVDFLRRTLRVDQQLSRVPGKGVALVGQLKTKSSYRSLPLPGYVADVIAAHLSQWPAHAKLGLVFTNARGAPIQESPFASAFSTACAKAHLPSWVTPHDLRHYFASLLIRSGSSVKVVQARLGHASAKTTLDVYGHLFSDEEDRTRAAIDSEFGGSAASSRPEQAVGD